MREIALGFTSPRLATAKPLAAVLYGSTITAIYVVLVRAMRGPVWYGIPLISRSAHRAVRLLPRGENFDKFDAGG